MTAAGTRRASEDLRPTLGLAALSFYAIGMILGAGIYSVLGKAAGIAGHALWLSFAVGGVAALLTGLSYAELATTYPKAGAEYVYLREAVPRWRWGPTAVGVVLALAGAATAATVSLAFGGYLGGFVPLPHGLVAALLLVALTAVNLAGVQESSRVNTLFTLVEVGGLVIVIVLGFTRPDAAQRALAEIGPGVLPAAALVFFAYLGFEEIANLAEEARDASRDIPRAILLGVGASTALYVLVALAATTLLSPEDLAASASPLADAARTAAEPLGGVLAAVALFATANTGLIALVATSRLVFGMTRGGDLPAALARTWTARGTPWAAALAMGALALAIVPLGSLELVAGLSSFAALLAFVIVNACVVILRFRAPEVHRPFRVPLAVGRLPLLPAAGIATSVVLLSQFTREVHVAGAIALLASVAIALVAGRRR